MDVKDYCSNVDVELTMWKAKIFDVIRKADQLGSADLEKVLPNIQDLKMVITEMEERTHQLRTECPLENYFYYKGVSKGLAYPVSSTYPWPSI
jgi:hypothetical protein